MGILLVIAVSQYLAANEAKENAEIQEDAANTAKKAADEAKKKVESTLARELFRPIGRQAKALNPSEVNALAALADLPKQHEPVRVRFLEEALVDLPRMRRFAVRVPAVVQAAVGLNRAVAAQAGERLGKKLRAPAGGMGTHTAAALAIAELDLA